MKVLHINICGNLSTGNIASDLIRVINEHGGEGILAYTRGTASKDIQTFKFGSSLDVYWHVACSRLTDRAGFYSKRATQKLIGFIESERPDLIHLHNLHGYYLNIEVLFDYLKRSEIPIVWTLHDCWAFTGHCCYFSEAGCSKWKTGCHDCDLKRDYPASVFIDSSKRNYLDKKKLFLGMKNMILVTPSVWLKQLVEQSFLSVYPCYAISNGVDSDIFSPRINTKLRSELQLENKTVVLGVASTWSERKGYKDFCKLSKIIDKDTALVMVGLNKQQIQKLPANVIGLERTKNVQELVELYSMADWYFNASVEETMGLTTIEAIMCQTPAIVYNATALPECVEPGNGYIVAPHDIEAVADIIKTVGKNGKKLKVGAKFEKREAYRRYYELYKGILEVR